MKPILFGAVLGVLWLIFGLPFPALAAVLPVVVQPVTVAFTAGLVARPLLPRVRRWAR